MRWEDERYVRLYTRDSPEWLALSWHARGLLALIMRALDRAGILKVGRLGLKGVAVAVHAPWADIEVPLLELLDDGCLVFDETSQSVVMPNFMAAQDAPQSDAARKRASRERALASAMAPRPSGHVSGPQVTTSDAQSQSVTDSHVQSRSVTSGHSVPSRAVPSRAEPIPQTPIGSDGVTPTVFRMPASETRIWGDLWVSTYELAATESLARRWKLEDGQLSVLRQAIETFCEDRTRIVEWIDRTVRDFVEGTREQDPKYLSAHQPRGLLRWLNGRPVASGRDAMEGVVEVRVRDGKAYRVRHERGPDGVMRAVPEDPTSEAADG